MSSKKQPLNTRRTLIETRKKRRVDITSPEAVKDGLPNILDEYGQ